MQFEFLLDAPQPRVKIDAVRAFVGGNDWDEAWSSDVFIVPETGDVMLRPAPLRPAFATSGSGINARLRKSDFTLTSASWVEGDESASAFGDWYLQLVGANQAVITTATQPANQPMFVRWFVYGTGTDDLTQMECGFNAATNGSSGLSFRISPTGRIEVYKDGVFRDVVTASGSRAPGQLANRFFGVLIIPGYRRNCVLLITTEGGVAIVEFDEIDPEGVDVLQPATKFWWFVPAGAAKVQCAKVQYPSSGYVASVPVLLAAQPTAAQVPAENVWIGDLNGGTLTTSAVKVDDVATTYTTGTKCRVKVALTGGAASPFLYGAFVEWPRVVANTAGPATELLPQIVEASLHVPESPANVTLDLSLLNPDATGAAQLAVTQFRPLEVLLDGLQVFIGVGEQPNQAPTDWNEEADALDLEFRDEWALLEQYVYRDGKPFDGLTLKAFVEDVLTDAGWPLSKILVEDDPFLIPSLPGARGRFNCAAAKGESAARVLINGLEAYAPHWIYGFRPSTAGRIFKAGSPDWHGTTPLVTLYPKISLAPGSSLVERRAGIFRNWRQEPLPIEATYVSILGRDLRTDDPIRLLKRDPAAEDPSLAPNLRPANWCGMPIPLGIRNDRITSIAVGERCMDLVFPRVTAANFVAEWSAEFIRDPDGVPLWRGDVLELDGKGIYRILSLDPRLRAVIDPLETNLDRLDWHSTPTRYLGLKL